MLCVFWYMHIDVLVRMRSYIVLTTSSEDEYDSDMSSEDNQELLDLFLARFTNAICSVCKSTVRIRNVGSCCKQRQQHKRRTDDELCSSSTTMAR